MKKIIIFFFLFFCVNIIFAQDSLINQRLNSHYIDIVKKRFWDIENIWINVSPDTSINPILNPNLAKNSNNFKFILRPQLKFIDNFDIADTTKSFQEYLEYDSTSFFTIIVYESNPVGYIHCRYSSHLNDWYYNIELLNSSDLMYIIINQIRKEDYCSIYSIRGQHHVWFSTKKEIKVFSLFDYKIYTNTDFIGKKVTVEELYTSSIR